jgi:light-regulated signal transduction histidine kinase (bacteriophytochrome)
VIDSDVRRQILEAQETIQALQAELAETNRGLVALTLELEQRVDERTKELLDAHAELKNRNAELVQLTLEMQAANRELEAFSYSVSHDLRTPLQSILGFSELLLGDFSNHLDEQSQYYIERVRAGCLRMAQIIDDMLKLARVTQSEIRKERVDLTALAKSIASTLALTQPQRPVKFVIADRLVATGDAGLLRAVLENLLGNAWKFTGKKSQPLIEFGCTEPLSIYFVRDNGTGFNMADVDKLFVAFQRLHTFNDFPGTGIGLATVQRIIRRHGGRIWAEAVVGEGATFYFTLESHET